MSIHYKALCAAVALTTATLFAVAPAFSKTQPLVVTAPRLSDLPTRYVSYRDLNLASVTDQRRLDRRVGNAVKDVCQVNVLHSDRSILSYGGHRVCSEFAWDGARPQIVAAIARAQAMALTGNAGEAVASLSIGVSAPAGG